MSATQKVMGHVYAIFTILVWGSCFVLTKQMLTAYTAIQIIPLRMGLAYITLWALRPKTLKLPWRDELMFILIGVTGGSFYFFLQNTALTYTFAANVSIIIALSPILTVILAQLFSRNGERLGKFVYIGAVIAIAGVVLVVLNGQLTFHLNPLGDLIALAAAIVLEDAPGGTIVTDSVTSSGLKTFLEQTLGGVHCRFKRGYKNVINEAQRLCASGVNAPLAIETSGHAALKDNYFLDDGAYLVTRIIIKAAQLRREGRTLEDLIAALEEPAESVELRFNILESDFKAYGLQVLERLEAYARRQGWPVAEDSREGVRTTVGDGWLLLRLSVHDPVMPLNIESAAPGGCRAIASALTDFMSAEGGLDKSQLDAYLS